MMVTALAASLKIYERRCESAMEVLLKLETPLLSDRRPRRRDLWSKKSVTWLPAGSRDSAWRELAAKFLSPCKTNPD